VCVLTIIIKIMCKKFGLNIYLYKAHNCPKHWARLMLGVIHHWHMPAAAAV